MSTLNNTVDFGSTQGCTLPTITSPLTDSSGNPVDLTTATNVQFIMNDLDGNEVVDAPASITNAVAGDVEYAWQTADVARAGTFHAQWIVTFSGGGKEAFPQGVYNLSNTNRLVIYFQPAMTP